MIKNFLGNALMRMGFMKAENLPRWLLQESEALRWTMPDPQVYANQADLYRRSQPLGTVVDAIVNACVEADMDIEDGNGMEDDSHPFMQLLSHPNPYDSRVEYLRAKWSWRIICGNSYEWLNRPNANAAPDEMWIIPPSKIIPVPDGMSGLKGYLYYPGNGAEIPLETWEIVHCKSFNPANRYLGLSLIESVAMILAGINKGDEWNTRLFAENNARLPGILAFKNMISDPDWKRLKAEVTDSAAKRQNMMLRGVGEGGVEWIQSSATQREMEFLQGIEQNTKRIYDRIAPGFYNMMTSNSSLANGQTGLFAFQKFTVQPLLTETAEKYNHEIMPAFGGGWAVDFSDVVPEDKAMELAEIEAFARYHTIDEVRVEKYGNEPDADPSRGRMFVSQLGSKQSEPPAQSVTVTPTAPVVEDSEDTPDITKSLSPAILTDLDRWRRMAKRVWGKPSAFVFTSDVIPADMHAEIVRGLKSAQSWSEARHVFGNITPAPVGEDDTVIKSLAASLEKAVEAAMKAETVTPAPVVNVAAPNVVNDVTVQPAHVVFPELPSEAEITTDYKGNKKLKVKK
jgi:phage portal protein BeeE